MLSWQGAGGKPKEEVFHPRLLCIRHVSHEGSGLTSIALEVQKHVVPALGHLGKTAALLPGTLPKQLWRVGAVTSQALCPGDLTGVLSTLQLSSAMAPAGRWHPPESIKWMTSEPWQDNISVNSAPVTLFPREYASQSCAGVASFLCSTSVLEEVVTFYRSAMPEQC